MGSGWHSRPRAIREPAVAGYFYPEDPDALRRAIDDYLGIAGEPAPSLAPKALIAPHAGYVYSGPVAAHAFATLGPLRETVRRVVLLGPSHRVAFRGIALPTADAFMTPLGTIDIAAGAVERLRALPQVVELDQAHALEHSLEVELPFLQRSLESFDLVPLAVGDASAQEVSEVLEALWGGDETLVLISSDLSHYHDYVTAQRIDTDTSRAIERLDARPIDPEHACGCRPICGLLESARARGLRATTLDQRNSGDTAGGQAQVVGYGAYAFA